MSSIDRRSAADDLRAGRWIAGTVVSSPDPVLAERLASGFDLIWIDLEHSALSIRDAQMLVIAVQAAGAAALVRVSHSRSDLLGALLDAGVDGVVAPKIESAAEAADLVRRMQYPPTGDRGFAPRRATGRREVTGALDMGSRLICIAQIETQRAVVEAGEIAKVEGIDALVVGTADLSFDLGSPLDLQTQELQNAVQCVGKAALVSGKRWGVAIASVPLWVRALPTQGGSVLVYASDARIYGHAAKESSELVRAVGAQPQASREMPVGAGATSVA
jgi:4-hydroxy-2-oxoheptanedioate aldolase